MTAPAPTSRTSPPTGTKLDDGFATLITISGNPAISFWEKTVTPPGVEGGDPVDTSTMHNVTWRTLSPPVLKTLTEVTLTAAYDPVLYDSTGANPIVQAINDRRTITVKFADGSTVAFYGYLRAFTPGDSSEGAQPEATVTIQPTNVDASNNEEGPVYTAGSGTT